MRIWISIIAIFISVGGMSQTFDGGIYAGLAGTQIDGDNFWGFNKAGPILGGYVDTYFDRSKTWGAKFGLRYIEKGSAKGSNDAVQLTSYKVKLHYIEMPLNVMYRLNKKFEFEGGISFGYLAASKELINGYEFDNSANPFNSFELAGFLGLGYHFNETWALSFQYMYSILPIRPHSAGSDITYGGQYNNLTLLCLNYKIKGK